jgi:hypothetical protein
MAPGDSVTAWLGQLKAGERAAVQNIWERYFRRLVGLARARLQGMPRRAADEEDVALSAFDTFCRGAEQGHFPRLEDRDDLWKVLVMLTRRKAARLVEHECAQKRGGGRVANASALPAEADEGSAFADLIGREPAPEFALQVSEELQRLLGLLGDEQLRQVALWKMEGLEVPAIASRLQRAPATVERKLRLIQAIWQQEGAPCEAQGGWGWWSWCWRRWRWRPPPGPKARASRAGCSPR